MDKVKEDVWVIRNVDEETKKLVRIYAATHNIPIAQALNQLIRIALEK